MLVDRNKAVLVESQSPEGVIRNSDTYNYYDYQKITNSLNPPKGSFGIPIRQLVFLEMQDSFVSIPRRGHSEFRCYQAGQARGAAAVSQSPEGVIRNSDLFVDSSLWGSRGRSQSPEGVIRNSDRVR